MNDAVLTIIEQDTSTIDLVSENEINILVLQDPDREIIEIVTEGPIGPPDTRPRPSEIAFSIGGDLETNDMLIRIEIADAITVDTERCRASAEINPDSNTELLFTRNGINIGSVVLHTDGGSTFQFASEPWTIQPGLLRVLSTNQINGLRDVSITIAGER